MFDNAMQPERKRDREREGKRMGEKIKDRMSHS